jgi:hypothetical protein
MQWNQGECVLSCIEALRTGTPEYVEHEWRPSLESADDMRVGEN